MRPNVIVLESRLPDGSGGDVVAAFRRRGAARPHAPVVVYSAGEVAERARQLQLGTTVFLTKGHAARRVRDQVLDLGAHAVDRGKHTTERACQTG